uniref:Ino80 complex subunit e n=1 Tax=Steinernema glaseri TaxID=37863 RepID=A0A1I7XX43_9BILA
MAPTGNRSGASGSSRSRPSGSHSGPAPKRAKKDQEWLYTQKTKLLTAQMDHIVKSNNILRNRLYHVRKEINYLKKLKRVLWQRLIFHGEQCFIESELEIPDKPDNEGAPSTFDKVMNDVATGVTGGAPKRRRNDPKKAATAAHGKDEDASRRLSQIIDGIISEIHNERLVARGQNVQTRNAANNIPVMSQQMEDKMLRESSCDGELPQGPYD